MISETSEKIVDSATQPVDSALAISQNKSRLGEFKIVPEDEIPITLRSGNYKEIIETLLDDEKIPDSFGLCGVIALYSLLHRYPRFSEIDFDLEDYFATVQSGGDSSARFKEEFANDFLLTDIDQRPVTTVDQMEAIFAEISQNNKEKTQSTIMVAYFCEYPNQEGQHMHWLFCEKADDSNMIIAGDLRPFGIDDTHIIKMSIENLVDGIQHTIGAESTAELPKSVIDKSVEDGDMSVAKKIQNNVSIKHFKE